MSEYRRPSGESKHQDGGAVVVVAILGETKTLLVQETSRADPMWKFVAETIEPSEPILDALVYGVKEEAGLDLAVERDDKRRVTKIVDPRITVATQLIPPHWVQAYYIHRRYFWGLKTTDAVIEALSGKKITGDQGEQFITAAFPLIELEKMVDFLRQHRDLIRTIHQQRELLAG